MMRYHYYFKETKHEVNENAVCLSSAVKYVLDNSFHFSTFSLFGDDLVQVADDDGNILAIVDLGLCSVYYQSLGR